MREATFDPDVVAGIVRGDVVRYGPAGALWEVVTLTRTHDTEGTHVRLHLRPVDPHAVAFDAKRPPELPMPAEAD